MAEISFLTIKKNLQEILKTKAKILGYEGEISTKKREIKLENVDWSSLAKDLAKSLESDKDSIFDLVQGDSDETVTNKLLGQTLDLLFSNEDIFKTADVSQNGALEEQELEDYISKLDGNRGDDADGILSFDELAQNFFESEISLEDHLKALQEELAALEAAQEQPIPPSPGDDGWDPSPGDDKTDDTAAVSGKFSEDFPDALDYNDSTELAALDSQGAYDFIESSITSASILSSMNAAMLGTATVDGDKVEGNKNAAMSLTQIPPADRAELVNAASAKNAAETTLNDKTTGLKAIYENATEGKEQLEAYATAETNVANCQIAQTAAQEAYQASFEQYSIYSLLVEQTEQEISTIDTSISELDSSRPDIPDARTNAEGKVENQSEIDEAKAINAGIDAKIAELKAQLAQKQQQLAQHQENQGQALAVMENTKTQLDTATADLATAQENLTTAQTEAQQYIEKLEGDAKTALDEFNSAKTAYAEANNKYIEVRQRISKNLLDKSNEMQDKSCEQFKYTTTTDENGNKALTDAQKQEFKALGEKNSEFNNQLYNENGERTNVQGADLAYKNIFGEDQVPNWESEEAKLFDRDKDGSLSANERYNFLYHQKLLKLGCTLQPDGTYTCPEGDEKLKEHMQEAHRIASLVGFDINYAHDESFDPNAEDVYAGSQAYALTKITGADGKASFTSLAEHSSTLNSNNLKGYISTQLSGFDLDSMFEVLNLSGDFEKVKTQITEAVTEGENPTGEKREITFGNQKLTAQISPDGKTATIEINGQKFEFELKTDSEGKQVFKPKEKTES